MSEYDQGVKSMDARLQKHGSGAHAHTANKARCYLPQYPEVLLPLCENALTNDDWKTLKFKMRKLW